MHEVYAIRGKYEFKIFAGTWKECFDYCRARSWKWIAPTWDLEITV